MNPILQFGTSRFLQAHVDLFVSEALERGQALGQITVVQTTGSASSAARIAAFNSGPYPVRIRGLQDGRRIEREQLVGSVGRAVHADSDWGWIVEQVASTVRVIVSNTGDTGYQLHPDDHLRPPRSFPAKLHALLHARYLNGAAPITLLPCELVRQNGSVLRDIVIDLATRAGNDSGFLDYLRNGCTWVNSLVDRIVSEPIEPAGAVAEPYALWAIEAQPGMLLPCAHPDIIVTDSLDTFERRKLFLLNLGHTWLAEQWLAQGLPADLSVAEAMNDSALRASLEHVWESEVLPVFDALGDGAGARSYCAQVRERFLNPFLHHRLADIAQNHAEKKRRRMLPLLGLAGSSGRTIEQPQLRALLDESPA